MTKKRRNNGRALANRGHVKAVRCANCGRSIAKDKAIKRFLIRSIIESAAARDILDVSAYEKNTYNLPKMYLKVNYCVACAIHGRIVRVRSRTSRRVRDPPNRFKRKNKKENKADAETGLPNQKPQSQQPQQISAVPAPAAAATAQQA